MFTILVIPTWKRLLIWMTRKPQGPVDVTEISRNVDCKILFLTEVLGTVSVTLV